MKKAGSGVDTSSIALDEIMRRHFPEPVSAEPYLGDTRFVRQAESCSSCSRPMEPRVFFGSIIGWRCEHCNPIGNKVYSLAGCNTSERNIVDFQL